MLVVPVRERFAKTPYEVLGKIAVLEGLVIAPKQKRLRMYRVLPIFTDNHKGMIGHLPQHFAAVVFE